MNKKELKEFEIERIKSNDGKYGNPLWVLIEGYVYDLTYYDHPGGIEVFEQDKENYRDLIDDFNDIGHSSNAINEMKFFLIGKLKVNE